VTDIFEQHREKIAFAGPDECWLWSAARNRHGYGMVNARGRMRLVHRETYEAVHGEGAADGLVVRHRCDVPACCNPAHLEPGTQADNNRDMVERGRHRSPGLKGETNPSAKLTEADIRTIRSTYVPGDREFSQRALARRFGVTQATISLVVRRESWGCA